MPTQKNLKSTQAGGAQLDSLGFRPILPPHLVEEFREAYAETRAGAERQTDNEDTSTPGIVEALPGFAWLYIRTLTGDLGPKDYRALSGPLGANLLALDGLEISAFDLPEDWTLQDDTDDRLRQGASADLLEILDWMEKRSNSASFQPFVDAIHYLAETGQLAGARAVDRERVFKHEMGRVLVGRTLLVRESATLEDLLHACLHHGADQICFVQTSREGPSEIADTEDKMDALGHTPDHKARVRLTLLSMRTADGSSSVIEEACRVYRRRHDAAHAEVGRRLSEFSQRAMHERKIESARLEAVAENRAKRTGKAPKAPLGVASKAPREIDLRPMVEAARMVRGAGSNDWRSLKLMLRDGEVTVTATCAVREGAYPNVNFRTVAAPVDAEIEPAVKILEDCLRRIAQAMGLAWAEFTVNPGSQGVWFGLVSPRLSIPQLTAPQFAEKVYNILYLADGAFRTSAADKTFAVLRELGREGPMRPTTVQIRTAASAADARVLSAIETEELSAGFEFGEERQLRPAAEIADPAAVAAAFRDAVSRIDPVELYRRALALNKTWYELGEVPGEKRDTDQFSPTWSLSLERAGKYAAFRRMKVPVSYGRKAPKPDLAKSVMTLGEDLALPGDLVIEITPEKIQCGLNWGQAERARTMARQVPDIAARLSLIDALAAAEAAYPTRPEPNSRRAARPAFDLWIVDFEDGRRQILRGGSAAEAMLRAQGTQRLFLAPGMAVGLNIAAGITAVWWMGAPIPVSKDHRERLDGLKRLTRSHRRRDHWQGAASDADFTPRSRWIETNEPTLHLEEDQSEKGEGGATDAKSPKPPVLRLAKPAALAARLRLMASSPEIQSVEIPVLRGDTPGRVRLGTPSFTLYPGSEGWLADAGEEGRKTHTTAMRSLAGLEGISLDIAQGWDALKDTTKEAADGAKEARLGTLVAFSPEHLLIITGAADTVSIVRRDESAHAFTLRAAGGRVLQVALNRSGPVAQPANLTLLSWLENARGGIGSHSAL